MIDISSPLSGMYATSVMENHHFAMAVSILQQVEPGYLRNKILRSGAKQLVGELAPRGVQGGDQQHQALHPCHRPRSLLPQQGKVGQYCQGEHLRLGTPGSQVNKTLFSFCVSNCFFGRNENLLVRGLAQAICMTGSDLSSSSKPWKAQYKTSFVVYEEFHEQVK